MNNVWDELLTHAKPINKGTARILNGGCVWAGTKSSHIDSDLPLPIDATSTHAHAAYIGKTFFRLTVMGIAAVKRTGSGKKLVCKCSCGNYTHRYYKQLKKEFPACGECSKKADRTAKDHWRTTGKDIELSEVWRRMGA